MIGIPQLDRLSTDDMISIIDDELRILVQDPRKLQTSVSDIIEPQLINDQFMDEYAVKTLLKMEIESRMGWAYLAEKIRESNDKDAQEV